VRKKESSKKGNGGEFREKDQRHAPRNQMKKKKTPRMGKRGTLKFRQDYKHIAGVKKRTLKLTFKEMC